MPLFEYECKTCGKIFEVFVQRRDPSTLPNCPECGTADVEHIFSGFATALSEVGGCGASSRGFG
jgi:putative FmdB family regulatory protein